MAALRGVVQRLFESPGQRPRETDALLAGAAACHRKLLECVAAREPNGPDDALDALLAAVTEASKPASTRRILNHPLLIDALHAMACEGPELLAWDEVTVPAEPDVVAPSAPAHGHEKLNNVAWPCLLHRCPEWCGHVDLCTDALGFLRFPLCDWSLWLKALGQGKEEALADTLVTVFVEQDSVRWYLASEPVIPFLVMNRTDCRRLVGTAGWRRPLARVEFPNPSVRPRLVCAAPVGHFGLRYEPVGFDDASFAAHAGLTGAVVQALLEAVRHNASAIDQELGRYITTVRGYELPAHSGQTLSSFSTPNLPGILNINICYSNDDQPLVNPFCFTWLGHELGHTKHYLIDDAVHDTGARFVLNPGDRTGTIARYDRSLAVRTLFQIPYVHLYELALLTDFVEHQFAGLPWDVNDDPIAYGDDLAAEISEAFDLIRDWARLTPLGCAALEHFHELYAQALQRWQGMRACALA
jgi:hypothetical protein